MLSDPDDTPPLRPFGADFRQVPEGVDPETWTPGHAGGRPPAGAGTADAPAAGAPATTDRVRRPVARTSTSRTCSAGCSAAGRGRGWGPIPGADQEAEIDADGRGGLPRRPPHDHPRRDRRHRAPSRSPSRRGDRRPAHPAGRQGGRGSDGAAAGDLYLVVRIAPHPRYRLDGRDITSSCRWPRGRRRSARRSGRHPGGEAKVRVPRRHVERAGGCGCAARACPTRAGTAGDLLRRGEDHGAAEADRTRNGELFEELAAVSDIRPEEARR